MILALFTDVRNNYIAGVRLLSCLCKTKKYMCFTVRELKSRATHARKGSFKGSQYDLFLFVSS